MRFKLLSFLAAAGLALATFFGWTAYAQKSKAPNKTWEYKVVRMCPDEKSLNELGAQGWELVSSEPTTRFACPALYFKRAK